jgi:hypothetical protein
LKPRLRGSEGDASPSWGVCEGAGPFAGAAKQVSELSCDGAWFRSGFPLQLLFTFIVCKCAWNPRLGDAKSYGFSVSRPGLEEYVKRTGEWDSPEKIC